MPKWVVSKLVAALNAVGKSVKGSKVLILGVAYKKNVDDVRESPAIKIMEILQEQEALLSYVDPYVRALPKMRDHHFTLKSEILSAELARECDAILIATDHDSIDYTMLQKESSLIIDTRGVYESDFSNVVRA